MTGSADLARVAIAAAARCRLRAGIDPYGSFCIYDLAESLGIDLRFQALATLEGMYSPGEPSIIVVSALRPSGRQRVTCAHEVGHHVFGHGIRIDELAKDRTATDKFSPEEFLANCFAEFLLMPKLSVLSAAHARRIDLHRPSPEDVYRLSSYFGVGYETVLHHLVRNLGVLSEERAHVLKKTTPKSIRETLVGEEFDGELFVADQFWRGRPLDLHIGDVVLLPCRTIQEGVGLADFRDTPNYKALRATASGLVRVECSELGWSSYVRIACRVKDGQFVGRSIYRHEEAQDE